MDRIQLIVTVLFFSFISACGNLGYDAMNPDQPVVIVAPRNGLVAEYLFNGNANDTSGNDNNGTISGTPDLTVTDRFGKSNSACKLNGTNEYIVVNENTKLDGFPEITISLWYCFPDSYMPAGNTMDILYKGIVSSGNTSYSIKYNETGFVGFGGFVFELHNENWDNYALIECATVMEGMNGWHHFVFTYNTSGNLKIYYDGISSGEEVQNTTDGNLFSQSNSLTIGRSPDGTDYFRGTIDDIRIYNRALSEEEINQLYNEGGYSGLQK